jgi:hypothetical protein
MEKSKITETDKGETGEGHAHNFSSTSRGLFTKNLSWQDKQSILHTALTFYGNCMKLCKDLSQNSGNKRIAGSAEYPHTTQIPGCI